MLSLSIQIFKSLIYAVYPNSRNLYINEYLLINNYYNYFCNSRLVLEMLRRSCISLLFLYAIK